MEQIFSDLGVDAMTGVRLMNALGLTRMDFSDPARFSKFQRVLDFVRQYTEDTQSFLISKVTNGKVSTDRLDKFFEYSQLMERKQAFERELESVRREASVIGTQPVESPIMLANTARVVDVTNRIGALAREIEVYEK